MCEGPLTGHLRLLSSNATIVVGGRSVYTRFRDSYVPLNCPIIQESSCEDSLDLGCLMTKAGITRSFHGQLSLYVSAAPGATASRRDSRHDKAQAGAEMR